MADWVGETWTTFTVILPSWSGIAALARAGIDSQTRPSASVFPRGLMRCVDHPCTVEPGERRNDRERDSADGARIRYRSGRRRRPRCPSPFEDSLRRCEAVQHRQHKEHEDEQPAARQRERKIDRLPESERPRGADKRAERAAHDVARRVAGLDEPGRRLRGEAQAAPLDIEPALAAGSVRLAAAFRLGRHHAEQVTAARAFDCGGRGLRG